MDLRVLGRALESLRRAFEISQALRLRHIALIHGELLRDRIPCTLVTDNMVGHLMQQGAIDAVVVGTDRTAANGDVANKIGTYTLAVLAARHRVPFYVAAPISSIDLATASGGDIPIEFFQGGT